VSRHRNQSAHRLVQQKHKAGANATNAAQSHTHTQIHIKNTKDTNTLDVQRSRQKGICFPSASPPPSLSPSLADPVPGPRHVWGRGQEGLGWPPSALLPAPWGPDGKLGLQPEPRLPPRLPSPPRLPAEAGEGSGGPPRTPGFASAAGWGPVLRGPDRARPPRGGPVRERPPGGRPRGPEGAEPAAFPAPGARAGGRGVARGRGRGSEAAGARGPVRGRDLSRAQARAGRVRAAAPGVCLGVGDSPSGPRGVTARLGMTGRPPSEGRGGTPRAERVERQLSGRAAARPPARPAVCAVLTCQVSVCGTRLGGAVTCQAVCVHAVPVGDGDPLEDVCVTAGGSQPESRFIS